MKTIQPAAWTESEFTQQLFAKEKQYHIHHPFHIAMHQGRLTATQIHCWVYNRFYYQIKLPCKDAAIIANCDDRAIRKKWLTRIIDQDGVDDEQGGIDSWIELAQACAITKQDLLSLNQVLPGVRFAVDAYVNFAKTAAWYEAACSSLTELFAPTIHQQRVDYWPLHYPWIKPEGLNYFKSRIDKAQRDVEQGLAITLQYFTTRSQQQRALDILQFKLDILWSMLDAISLHCNFTVKNGAA
jgi:pyrroloquinoline-quinone synthase